MNCQHESQMGRVGELMVAMNLERMGIRCSIVNLDGIDIIAYLDKAIQIEVKSNSKIDRIRNKYAFKTNSNICDMYAFVALDLERIVFKAEIDCRSSQIRIPPEEFKKKAETTWASAVSVI